MSNVVPILHQDGARAEAAWQRHKALLMARKQCPALNNDPRFVALCNEAYSDFESAFEVVW